MTNEQRVAMQRAAHEYCNKGWSIIPVGSDKRPLLSWKQYQNEKATHEQIEAWFKQWPYMNIGIVCGAVSGIVVIDIEAGGSIEGFPPTVMSKTGGGGFHLCYRHPGYEVKNGVRIAPLTDIRGDAGYVLAPPSISDKGSYEWIASSLSGGMAEYPAEIIKALRKPTETKEAELLLPDCVPVGQRNDAAARFTGNVLSKLPMDLWPTAGWGALKEWNATQTEKPLDERELRGVFESIKSREAVSRRDPTEEDFVIKPFTLTKLLAEEFPPELWLAENLIPLSGVTAITGDSNTYKSFLSLMLAASVAQGQPFLGHFATRKGKVLIIDEENHRRYIQKRFKDMGMTDTENIIFLSQAGLKLDKENCAKALKAVLEKEQPTLVVLDSLVRFHSKEENSATEMSKVMSEVKGLVGDNRAVVFIHHHKKEQGFQRKNSGQSVRGSSDIYAALDCCISVDLKDNHLILNQNKLRVQKQLEPFKVSRITTENGGLSFTYAGTDESRQDKVLEVAEEIKAVLAASAEPLPVKVLLTEVGTTRNLIDAALKLLEESRGIAKERRAHNTSFYFIPDGAGVANEEEIDEPDEPEDPENGAADEGIDPNSIQF